jgi:hypothetical protein
MKKLDFLKELKVVLFNNGFVNVDEILNEKEGFGVYEKGKWYVNCSDCVVDDVEEIEDVIFNYCDDIDVEIIS